MTEDDLLKRNIQEIISICDAMVGYECDEVDFLGETRLVFGKKYRYTRTPFYGLRIFNNCKLQHPEQNSILFVGCPPDDIQQILTDLLLNQVVALVAFNIETLALEIKFENGLTLTLPNDNEKESYALSRNYLPDVFAGRGTDYFIQGKNLWSEFWMS